MLALTKIGNLKIGLVSKGRPIATEKILVTRATKDNQENFAIYPGFNQEGEDKIEIRLPFNDPKLNFEVNYVSFGKIGDDDYMFKAEDLGKTIYAIPYEDPELTFFSMGVLNEELRAKFKMEKTGFLKVMIPGVSGFGEVFYFKTRSLNTISAIKSELKIIDSLMGGLFNVPLILKPVKKDIGDKSIVFVSLSLAGDPIEMGVKRSKEIKGMRKKIEKMEDAYKKSRQFEAQFYTLGENLIAIEDNNWNEVAKTNFKVDKNEEYLKSFVEKHKIGLPIASLKALLGVSTKKEFEDFVLNTENLDVVLLMKEVSRKVSSKASIEEPKKRGRGRPRKKEPKILKNIDKKELKQGTLI